MQGKAMNPPSQSSKSQEMFMQEPYSKAPADSALPARQVIAEKSKDAKEHLAPPYIP